MTFQKEIILRTEVRIHIHVRPRQRLVRPPPLPPPFLRRSRYSQRIHHCRFRATFGNRAIRVCLIIVERSMNPLVSELFLLYSCITVFPDSVAASYPPLQAFRRYGEHHDEGRYESEGRRGRGSFAFVPRTTLWTSRIVVKRVTVTLDVGHVAVGAVGMLAHVRPAAARMMRPRGR